MFVYCDDYWVLSLKFWDFVGYEVGLSW
jgi:hypothetical protein